MSNIAKQIEYPQHSRICLVILLHTEKLDFRLVILIEWVAVLLAYTPDPELSWFLLCRVNTLPHPFPHGTRLTELNFSD